MIEGEVMHCLSEDPEVAGNGFDLFFGTAFNKYMHAGEAKCKKLSRAILSISKVIALQNPSH